MSAVWRGKIWGMLEAAVRRPIDVGVGLGLLLGAIIGVVINPRGEVLALPVLSASAMHVMAGWLFLRRDEARREGSWEQRAAAVPSIVLGGLMFALAPSGDSWGWLPLSVLALGLLWALVGLASLGESFAIFAARRRVVRRGLYRWQRHPVYAGELVMLVGCSLAWGSWEAGVMMALMVGTMVVRVLAEERLLVEDEEYRAYCEECRWRFVPGVW